MRCCPSGCKQYLPCAKCVSANLLPVLLPCFCGLSRLPRCCPLLLALDLSLLLLLVPLLLLPFSLLLLLLPLLFGHLSLLLLLLLTCLPLLLLLLLSF